MYDDVVTTNEAAPKISGELADVVSGIESFNPESVFLYGSRARTDHLKISDHEVGVLFPADRYVGRSELAKAIGREGYSIYPFRLEDFIAGKIDTPFQRAIYMRELVEGGKTIAGKPIIEGLRPSEIKTLDLLQRINFDLGYALAAVMAERNGDNVSAGQEFAKSCLFGIRCLEILQLRQFPLTYDEIYELSSQVTPAEYQQVVDAAFKARQTHEPVPSNLLFKNISLLNQVVQPALLSSFEQQGNSVVLP